MTLMIRAFKFTNLVDLVLIAMIEVAKIEVSVAIQAFLILLSLFCFSQSLLIHLVSAGETGKVQLSWNGGTQLRAI